MSAFGEKKQKVKISYKCNFFKKDQRAPSDGNRYIFSDVGYVEFILCMYKKYIIKFMFSQSLYCIYCICSITEETIEIKKY